MKAGTERKVLIPVFLVIIMALQCAANNTWYRIAYKWLIV